jgi:serine/threonine protein kinase
VIGQKLGPYEVREKLGEGGMGEVYRARDTRLDRIVAIKVLSAQLAADPQFRQRFDREARAISALEHPHICSLYDVGEQIPSTSAVHDPSAGPAQPIAFLVMQYLEGETLADRLMTGALALDQALEYAIQIADALDKAHRAGIVHRDLKPGNIMLTKGGVKLLDFGLAKAAAPIASAGLSMLPTTPPGLTAQGSILGTLQYMAPEQLEGRDTDARTDIFAFGAVLHELVTGMLVFLG